MDRDQVVAAEPTDPMRDEVEQIISIEDEARYRAEAGSFIARNTTLWRRIASHLCHSNSVKRVDFIEDVESHVMEVVWEMLEKSRRDINYLLTMRSFPAIVVFNARPKVRSFLDHATAPAAGMVGAQRRRREIQRTRSEMSAMRGQEPTLNEVIEATNARLAATRKNPTRQGMVVSAEDDLAFRSAMAFDETIDSDLAPVDFGSDFILHPAEGPVLVRTVVQMAKDEDDTLGRVAELWMTEAYSDGGPPPGHDTVSWIARSLGMTRKKTSDHIARVRELGVEYLARMGITDLNQRSA